MEGGSIYDIEIGLLGAEHGKSVVMARGDGDIFGPRSFDGRHPFGSIEPRRIKAGGKQIVFRTLDVLVVLVPLALGGHTVYSPMQEDTEFLVLKFFSCL